MAGAAQLPRGSTRSSLQQENKETQKAMIFPKWLLAVKVNLSLLYFSVYIPLGEHEHFEATPQTNLVPNSKMFLLCKD